MKITAFDDLHDLNLALGNTTLVTSSGSNAGFAGDVTGAWGDLTVVGLRQQVTISSNLTPAAVGDVLTIIRTSPAYAAQFATPSNTGGGGDLSGQLGAGFDGGLSVLVAGKAQDVIAPFDGTITDWVVKAQQDGDATFGIAKITNPATDAMTSIVGATAPSLSSARYATGSDMTGWSPTVVAGDIFRFTLSSVSTIRQVIVVLDYSRP